MKKRYIQSVYFRCIRWLLLPNLCAGYLLFVATAGAANLTVSSDAPSGSPLVLTPTNASSPLVVTVTNDQNPDPPADFLTAWQMRLSIVPDADATGTLEFLSAAEPTGYVLAGVGHLGPSVTNSGTQLFAQDFNIPDTGGVQVATAPGANLLSIQFDPSANALGTFGIFALDGITNSEWTNAATPIKLRRTFANVPDGGGPVRIGEVFVTFPGDYDFDNDVDGVDYLKWKLIFGSTADLAADGNGDGIVNAADYTVWLDNLGAMPAAATAAGNAVPEPGTALLMLLGTVNFYLSRRRASRLPI